MVPILSSSTKLSAGWIFTPALFGLGLVSSMNNQATDITQEGQEPALPGATKMTFIVPVGGLEEASLQGSELPGPADPDH